MLMGVPVLTPEARAPHSGINFSDGGAAGGNLPTVEGPKVDALAKPLTNEPQPRNSSMRRFRHRALHIELKDGLRAARPFLGEATPTTVPGTGGAVALAAFAYRFYVDVFIRRPMALEVVEEGRPVQLQAIVLKVLLWKRKAVVDSDQHRRWPAKVVDQPFGDLAPRPVFAGRWRGRNLGGRRVALRLEYAQAR